jgi:hypothetical protein
MATKTDAQKIMEARHASYANYPGGMVDETDLLLLQQHFGELNARKKAKATAKVKRKGSP